MVLIFLMWIAGNIPNKVDVEWLKRGGGIVGHDHPPAYRFNAGQKMIYWIVVLGGGAVAVSGYLLMFPFYATDIAGMQLAQIVHGVVAVLFVAAMLAHIYIGTIGMEGAFEAMGTGTVDVNWAKQHHSLWLERGAGQGRTASGGSQRQPGRPAARHPGGITAARKSPTCDARRLSAGRFGSVAIRGPCASSDSPAGAARARPRWSPRCCRA